MTKAGNFQLNFSQIDQTIGQKGLLCIFQQCLGPFDMLTIEGCSETGPFRHLSNHVFRSIYFRKYISYEAHLLFQNVQNFKYISDMK